MTFASPYALAALALLPLLLLADLWARRRRRRFAVAYSNLPLLAAIAGGPSWRRLARLVALLGCLALAIVGVARPEVAVSVPREGGTVALVLDTSGSMVAQDVAPDRMTAARNAAVSFVDDLPATFDLAVVPFSTTAGVAVPPTRDRSRVRAAIASLEAGGGTALGDAIQAALAATGGPEASPKGRAILLLSDGANTSGSDPRLAIDAARRQGVKVTTIAFGTDDGVVVDPLGAGYIPVPPDREALRSIAEKTGGTYFEAHDAEALRRVYDKLGTRLGTIEERRDVAYGFAAAAALLLALAGVLSLPGRSALT